MSAVSEVSEGEKEGVLICKWDASAVKNALDDSIKHTLVEVNGYEEKFRLVDTRLAICTLAVLCAGFALAFDFLYPFPQSRPILIACVLGYFFLMGVLTLYTTYVEKGIFCVAVQKDPAGLDPDNVLEASSHMNKFDDKYDFSIRFLNGLSNKWNERHVTRSCADFIDENGLVCQDKVDAMVNAAVKAVNASNNSGSKKHK